MRGPSELKRLPELVYDEVEGRCYGTDGAESGPCEGDDAGDGQAN
ncbi:hypothetical protein [Nannocystis punicea]|uniref:Uncharacterized protein n=1 Tax=Nannocystis punicea TaxID=2995304 RepID=A0ABY7HHS6_9BACT|nr:hypothetical protein [Nannocystis poenicansa]WAS98865.1 hypothetical protein O0S08_22270 [Nannocystis poenicansa]